MATITTNFLKLADLSQLMSVQVALLDLNVERNQSDNDEVLTYVNDFLDVLDRELKSPRAYKEYVFSKKDDFVRSNFIARLELVASRILEKKAMTCSTLSLDSKNFYQEELNFFVDLYFLLATSMIDISAIRKEDLLPSTPYDDVFGIMKEHMFGFLDFDELNTLRAELDERKDDYPGFPMLQQRIAELAAMKNTEDGDFVFSPPRSVSDYSSGDVLVTLKEDSEITDLLIGELPAGLQLNAESGEIFVESTDALVAGKYDVLVRTSDAFGGVTSHLLSLPIGGVEIAKYEVAPYRVVADYLAGDILARTVITDDVIEIVKAEWGIDQEELPNGVALDEITGDVVVEDEDMLEIGTFPVRVILTNKIGLLSKHEFSLSFKQDKNAIYTFNSPKALKLYQKGEVVASVKDEDGTIIGAHKNKMPDGLELDASGDILVGEPKLLRAGTHQFNLVSKSSANVTSLKTLFVTINPSRNPYYYDTSGLSPIGDINPGDALAKLFSLDGTVPEKVRLLKGVLPNGATIASSGDLIASDPSKLVAGNYDLRFTAFTHGIDATALENLQIQLIEKETILIDRQNSLAQHQIDLASAKSALVTYQATMTFDVNTRQKEIADLEIQLQAAPAGSALALQLTQLIQTKQEELNQFYMTIEASFNAQVATITQFETAIVQDQTDIATYEEFIRTTTAEIIELKRNKWIRYEVNLVLTLEEDQPSAWHIEIPKDWDDYVDNEVIAQLIDCDGYSNVQIVQGTLPAGLKLNKKVGTIEVSDHSLLLAGEYVMTTKSTDKQKGSSTHRLAIIIGGSQGAKEEVYTVLPGKPANNYSEGEILGYPYNTAYAIVSGRLSMGLLPSGVAIDPTTGAIFVEDPELLKSGVHEGIVIKTINTSGGVYYHTIAVSFVSSTVFLVNVSPPKAITDYQDGESIVSVSVNQGTLQGVQLVNGTLANGTGLNSANGAIVVSNTSDLVAGDYQVELFMAESKGATDQKIIDFTIGTDGGINAPVVWFQMNPINKATVAGKAVCASPSIANRTIVSATLAPLPSGFLAISSNGVIRVGAPDALLIGMHVFNVALTDDRGMTYIEQFSLEVIDSSGNGTTIVTAIVAPGRDFHVIKDGDILARLDPEAAVSSAILVSGEIPNASDLIPTNGRIVVADRYKLGRGSTTGELSVMTSTSTSIAVAQAELAQIVAVTIENKPIPDFSDPKSTWQFLLEMEARLASFEALHLGNPDVSGLITPLFDKLKTMAVWLSSIILDPVSDETLKSAGFDGKMLKEYILLGGEIIDVFQLQTDALVQSSIADLYNEMYTTQMAIFLYRNKDISDLSTNPVTRIIQTMVGHLEIVRKAINAEYMVNNALIMSEFIPQTVPILTSRFSLLLV